MFIRVSCDEHSIIVIHVDDDNIKEHIKHIKIALKKEFSIDEYRDLNSA